MIIGVTITSPALTWIAAVAMAVSGARMTVAARALRPPLAT
jgi:hypothetical protein